MSDINYLPNARNQGAGNGGASPWAVSGFVTVLNPSTISLSGLTLQTSAVQQVSGGVSIINTPSVSQSGGPWAVSGTVSISNTLSVSIPNPLGVSGTITASIPGPLGVSGSVTVANFPAPGTQAVSGAVSITNFPAPGTQTVSGAVSITNFPAPGTQTVSGTISIGNSPSVSQTAGPWAVSGTVTVTGAKSSNAGVADGTNLGVLPAVANAASPAYIEGNQVALSTDLAGNLRVVTSGTVAITSGPSLISTVNSSTAPLSGSGTFTGGWEDVSGYSAIVVSVFTDQASASGGLSPQFSSNGVNADFSGVHAITPSGGVYSFSPRARYFRLVYMNGAVAQGTLRLQTIYHPLAILPFTISPMVPTGDPNPTTQRVAANLQVRNPNDSTWQALSADASGRVTLTGDTPHGATDSGNPVEVGFGAVAHGTNPTAVAAGQRTRGYANRAGVPFHIGGHPNVQTIAQNYTSAQTDTAIATISTGTKIVVTGFMIVCHMANTVNVAVRLGFGTVNTPAYGSAGLLGTHPGIAPGSGLGRGNGAGIIGVGADDADLRFTCTVPTGGSIDVMVSYYTIES